MLKTTTSVINASQITGVLPVVNGGTGVTTSTGTGSTVLSTTPSFTGNVTLSTGNLIVSDGKGIDFSATPGTGTSELLDDYEEGTWTPTDASGAGLVFTDVTATYTKIGRQVTVQCLLNYPANVNGAAANLGGLPFTNQANGFTAGAVQSNSSVTNLVVRSTSSSTGINIFTSAGAQPTNAQLSTNYVLFALTYFTA